MGDQQLENGRIPALDGLRGLAIIAVILCHVNWAYGGPFSPGSIDGPVAMVFGWGWVGVDLFFVLSGFLITGILYDAKESDGYFRNFYARRALRIFPLYYGFLLCLVALNRLDYMTDIWLSHDRILSFATYTYNLRVGLGGAIVGHMHHFWSLAIEEHFYLIWPLVVAALSRSSLMRACLVLATISFLLRVALIGSGVGNVAAFFLTPCRVDSLLAGSWVALAWKHPADRIPLRQWAGPVALAVGGLLLGIAIGQGHFLPDVAPGRMPNAVAEGALVTSIGVGGLAILFSSLLVMALSADETAILRRALENKHLCSIGKYSYAIYVFHALVLLYIVQLLSFAPTLPLFAAKALVAVCVVATSFVLAWLSYHMYEKHFLRLKPHFESRKSVHSFATVGASVQPVSNA